MRWRIRLFGTFQVEAADGGDVKLATRQACHVLARLCLSAKPVRRDALAEIWDSSYPSALASLRTCLSSLRTVLGDSLLADRETVALREGDFQVDVREFEHLVGLANQSLSQVEELGYLRDAARLYAGPVAFQDDSAEIHRYEEMAADVFLRLGRLEAETQRLTEAIESVRRASQIQPYSEEAVSALMKLHSDNGEPGLAVEAFELFRKKLKADLHLAPSEALSSLRDTVAKGLASPRIGPGADVLVDLLNWNLGANPERTMGLVRYLTPYLFARRTPSQLYTLGTSLLKSLEGHDFDKAALYHLVGYAAYESSRYEEARHFLELALSEGKDLTSRSTVLTALGITMRELGRYEESLRYLDESWEVAKDLESPTPAICVQIGLAGTRWHAGDVAEAERLYRETVDWTRRVGNFDLENVVWINLCMLYAQARQIDEAIEARNHSRALVAALGTWRYLDWQRYCEASIELALGHFEKASADLAACAKAAYRMAHARVFVFCIEAGIELNARNGRWSEALLCDRFSLRYRAEIGHPRSPQEAQALAPFIEEASLRGCAAEADLSPGEAIDLLVLPESED